MFKSRSYIVIRDDDICYFTEPWELERVHKPLLESNKPINIAVIPLIDSKLNEPFVKKHLEELRYVPIGLNKDLVEFVKQYNFEVLQHGLTHSAFIRYRRLIHEFNIKNKEILRRRAVLGIKILSNVFGRPRFFVPPWDSLSKEGYEVLSELYQGVLLASMGHLRGIGRFSLRFLPWNIPLKFMPFFIMCRMKLQNYCFISNRFLVIEHQGLVLSPRTGNIILEMVKEFVRKHPVVVILVHYWLLLRNPSLLALWRKLLDVLLSMSNVYFTRVSEIFRIMIKTGGV